MFIRYLAESGDISGVFPVEHWTGHVPEGQSFLELELDQKTAQQTMESPAEFTKIVGQNPLELANDLSRRRKIKTEEMAESALEQIRSLFRTSHPEYEVLGIHNAKLLANNSEDYPPRYTAAMELIRATNMKLEQKLYEVALSENPEEIQWS